MIALDLGQALLKVLHRYKLIQSTQKCHDVIAYVRHAEEELRNRKVR